MLTRYTNILTKYLTQLLQFAITYQIMLRNVSQLAGLMQKQKIFKQKIFKVKHNLSCAQLLCSTAALGSPSCAVFERKLIVIIIVEPIATRVCAWLGSVGSRSASLLVCERKAHGLQQYRFVQKSAREPTDSRHVHMYSRYKCYCKVKVAALTACHHFYRI